eukprot:3815770-Amphidinium_carterae.1
MSASARGVKGDITPPSLRSSIVSASSFSVPTAGLRYSVLPGCSSSTSALVKGPSNSLLVVLLGPLEVLKRASKVKEGDVE